MDVVALAQHGLGHAVATLGTATTPQHLQQLLRLSDHIVFMFDGDTAGRRAAARALETALPFASEKSRIDFAFLPQEHDPDSFVREHGAEKLKEWVGNARPLSAFLLDVAAQDQQLEYAEGKAAAVAQAQRMLKLMPANVLRAQVTRETARRFDVSESSILAALGVKADTTSDGSSAGANKPAFKPRAKSGVTGSVGSVGASVSGRPPIRLPRPVIRPLTERILQIVVRVPDWSMQLDDEFLQSLDSLQAALLQWIQTKCRQRRVEDPRAITTFAMLHESALAEGRDRGPEAVRLFLKLAKPDQALDELVDNHLQQAETELADAILRHQIRVLEEAATELAATAAQDPRALADLQAVRVRIGELKASAH